MAWAGVERGVVGGTADGWNRQEISWINTKWVTAERRCDQRDWHAGNGGRGGLKGVHGG